MTIEPENEAQVSVPKKNQTTAKKKSNPKKLKKKKKKKKKSNNNNNNACDLDFDTDDDDVVDSDNSAMEKAIRLNKEGQCQFGTCQVVTSLIMVYTTCRHCRHAFCTSHSMPEIHGCGEAAKVFARKEWLEKSKQGEKMTKAKKELAQNTLHTKLKSMQDSRAPKDKKKKKKK